MLKPLLLGLDGAVRQALADSLDASPQSSFGFIVAATYSPMNLPDEPSNTLVNILGKVGYLSGFPGHNKDLL